jgi:hypothetical protein
MFLDPENFTVAQRKQFGMWPDANMISLAMIPYIKRMRTDSVTMLIAGDKKGENIVDFVENVNKFSNITVLNKDCTEDEKRVFQENTKDISILSYDVLKEPVNIVCVADNACTEQNLVLLYEAVKQGGIFCGNGHETNPVKTELNKFRRNSRIGTPIMIANRTIWFWNKR